MEQISFMSILPNAQILERLNFSTSKMMVLSDISIVNDIINPEGFEIITSNNEEYDDIAIQSWKNMWIESGCCVDEINTNATHEFIKQARSNYGLQYKTIVAKDILTNKIVGSLSSMFWQGEAPINTNDKNIGTVWGVYVNPLYRRRGIGFAMMQACCIHWRTSGCFKGVLIYASEEGKRVYERIGFIPRIKYENEINSVKNISPYAMIKDLKKLLCKESNNTGEYYNLDFTNERHLLWLTMALPRQLNAIFDKDNVQHKNIIQAVTKVQKSHGTFINPDDNWFTQNIKRFGGGFDMQELANDPKKLASKFDRLAPKYDQWATGNRSKTDNWLVKQIRSDIQNNNGKQLKCLDISCGIGLPAHTLRLCGITEAYIVGTDISKGMLVQANRRYVYDTTFLGNANLGYNDYLPDENFDLIICMGAMELLDYKVVLSEIARLLKKGGKVWLSFQWENSILWNDSQHPTSHQNVYGLSIEECKASVENVGLKIISIDECCDAFYTPSHEMDGTMNPVPYLFVVAEIPKNYL